MPDNKRGFDRGQQLSDKLASRVSSGKLSFTQAMKIQKQEDEEVIRNAFEIGREVRGSSQDLASKRKYVKPSFKIDRNGNLKAF